MKPLFDTTRNNLLMYLTRGRGANVREQFTNTAIGLPELDSNKLHSVLTSAIHSKNSWEK